MADVDWVYRSDWGAREARSGYGAMPARPKGVKVHYTGGRENAGMSAKDGHGLCLSRARSIQNGHMDGNGWIDVGYSYLVCAHGRVFVGRGWGNLPAANGPGLNSGHYAVLGMVGNSGLSTPPAAMLNGIRDVIDYLRSRGVGSEIKGHRDGYSTDCPGGELYRWVLRGAPRPDGPTPTKPNRPDPTTPHPTGPRKDEMDDYTSLALSIATADRATVATKTPTDVVWDVEYADPTRSHVDKGANPSFLDGPARYSVDIELILSGVVAGDVVETRLVEVKAKTSPAQVLEATVWRPSSVLPGGDGTFAVTHGGIGAVQEGRKLRVQISHNGSGSVKIVRGWLRMRSQPS